jgi:heterodisulfide reductase subunit A
MQWRWSNMGESEMVTITIDGKQIQVEEGTTILEAAEKHDIEIPSLCYNVMIGAIGTCRLCVSEIAQGGKSKVVSSCNYPIRKEHEKAVISTKSETILKTRRDLLEIMLSRWPNVSILKYYETTQIFSSLSR